jgi:TonB family protein
MRRRKGEGMARGLWTAAAMLAIVAIALPTAQAQIAVNAPTWTKRPTENDVLAVFPAAARSAGVGGRVILSCVVSERGVMETCVIVEETPKEFGFGAAALLVARYYFMKPAMSDGKPTRATVRLPVTFQKPEQEAGSLIRGTRGSLIRVATTAYWEKAPTWSDLVAANPTAGSATPVAGSVGLRCRINANGALSVCQVVSVVPKGRQFEVAAKTLAETFELANNEAYRKGMDGVLLNLGVSFPDPSQTAGERRLAKPEWKSVVTPEAVTSVFPAQALKAGLKSGRGTLDCVAKDSGALDQCKVVSEEPAGMGFGGAALSIATAMQLNPWNEQAGPVGGTLVRLPIVVKVPDGAAPAAGAAQ